VRGFHCGRAGNGRPQATRFGGSAVTMLKARWECDVGRPDIKIGMPLPRYTQPHCLVRCGKCGDVLGDAAPRSRNRRHQVLVAVLLEGATFENGKWHRSRRYQKQSRASEESNQRSLPYNRPIPRHGGPSGYNWTEDLNDQERDWGAVAKVAGDAFYPRYGVKLPVEVVCHQCSYVNEIEPHFHLTT